ncbi:Hsp33-like chaperonin [Methylobacterium indicum]|uniref:33 kDa chaperonin n=1 Tax=Methylobacterium indicum TaxID=1775910 RepID=A0A8H8WV77_9HYPH|nr:Hsp33 family molecular chaperone [Methylobacterium indicum]KTS24897.1 Hsp33-like chaperonin [Methylobacterium indicum]KTS37656.1 Hsp33-like chaperonin [Methylobacterium indicum]KTS47203.1 Hsp33-like chaperonin [Methylobacterium indicum]BCM84834.1 33 kDa chaperonin [Methylobacterium indicum]
MSETTSPQNPEGRDDAILPFAVEPLDVRGRAVRLGPSIDTILRRHGYPDTVARLLGEAAALTVLLGSSLKFEGRFQLQTKSDGPVDMVVVDFEAPDRLRATARFDAGRVAAAGARAGTAQLLGHGHLAMTIDQGSAQSRYQGVVALEGQGFEEAAHQYFRQSEQIPTRVRLAVAEQVEGGGQAWRAGGLLMQFLPHSPERARLADLPPGDLPEGHALLDDSANREDDAWVEAKSLVATIEDHELVDPTVSSERLLYRLFHERGVRVFEAQGVHEACRCSRERVMGMVRNFSAEERRDIVGEDGRIGITCEFCSRHYDLDPAEVEAEIAGGPQG